MMITKWKQKLAFVLGLAVTCTSIPTSSLEVKAATNTAPLQPDGLRTELLREAYGIDTKNPSFSWVDSR